MSDEIKDINEVFDPTKKSPTQRNMELALERERRKQEAEKAAFEEAERKRKDDGRHVDLEVDGFNIGEAIWRRNQAMNERVDELKRQMEDEDMERAINEDENYVNNEIEESEEDWRDETPEDDVDDIFGEEDMVAPPTPVRVVKKEEVVETNPIEAPEKDADINPTVVDTIMTSSIPEQSQLADFDEEDLAELEDDEDTTDMELDPDIAKANETRDDRVKDLRKQILKVLGICTDEDQTGPVSIEDKEVTVSQLLSGTKVSTKEVADWPAMITGKIISVSAWSGADIEQYSTGADSRNVLNSLKDKFRIMYDHIVSEKPSFMDWLKNTPYADLEHYDMAAYKASFHGSNYIPMECTDPKCDHVFLTDNIDITPESGMITFANDEAKERFNKILKGEEVKDLSLKEPKRISKNLGIKYREPSIYSTVFENVVLDEKFIQKYSNLIRMVVYIDMIYMIDDNGKYYPVRVKQYTGNNALAKNSKARIVTFGQILKEVPSDIFSTIFNDIVALSEGEETVSYGYPEIKCSKCDTVIPAQPLPATRMFFRRHRLSQL